MVCKDMECAVLHSVFQQINNKENYLCLSCWVAGCDLLQYVIENTWKNECLITLNHGTSFYPVFLVAGYFLAKLHLSCSLYFRWKC